MRPRGKRKRGQFVLFFAPPNRCISCAMTTTSIRAELQQHLRTLLGDRVWFSASAQPPQGWLQNARVQQLLHDLITALSTQLQFEAVGAAAQGDLQEARRLRARERAVSELRRQQWHLPEVGFCSFAICTHLRLVPSPKRARLSTPRPLPLPSRAASRGHGRRGGSCCSC
jgi:hypothetical protein